MHNKKTLQFALINSLATFLYIAVIVTILQSASMLAGSGKSLLAPVVFLLLFVISAAVTGGLVLGKPLMWYLDGKKKDAIALFCWTVAFLLGALIAVSLILISSSSY